MKDHGTSSLMQRMASSLLQHLLCAAQMPEDKKRGIIKNLPRLEETPQKYSIFVKEILKHFFLNLFIISLCPPLPESFCRVFWKK